MTIRSITPRMASARRVLLVLALAPLVAACGDQVGAALATPYVGIVAAQRANSAAIGWSSPKMAGIVSRLAGEQARVFLVSADGNPALTRSLDLSIDAPNALYAQRAQVANQERLAAAVAAVRSTTAEADPLAAIQLAARAVADGTGQRHIVVYDDGLQTTAPLQMQTGLLGDPPQTTVSFLRAEGELPDLHGISIEWIGLGATTPPQVPLTAAAYERLKNIWAAILQAAGASSLFIDPEPLPAASSPQGLPRVTPVDVPSLASAPPALHVSLDPASVDFVPDEDRYRDPARADVVLAQLAQAILAGGYHRVSLVGTTAVEPGQALSLLRAQRVASTLAADGVPAQDMTVSGVGTHFPGFVPVDPRTPASQLNRLVIITATAQ